MKRNKKSINVLFLGMFIALVVIAIAGMNMRTLINSNGVTRIARKAGANDAVAKDVLENYTFTSDTAGINQEGTIKDYSEYEGRFKLLATAAPESKIYNLTLSPGYYTHINVDATDVYNEGYDAGYEVGVEDSKVEVLELSISGTDVNATDPPNPNSSVFEHTEGSINTGYVIRDKNTGNEFVWVPVKKDQKISLNVEMKENITSLTLTDPFGSNISLGTVSGKTYTNTNITPTVNGMYTATVTTASGTKTQTLVVRSLYAVDAFNDYPSAIGKATPDYTDTVDYTSSVNTHGGFYIGRYEAGSPTPREWSHDNPNQTVAQIISTHGIPVCKQNQIPYAYITISQAKGLVESMYTSSSYICTLLTGAAWDRTLDWLIETGNKTLSEVDFDSSNWGNYYNSTFYLTQGKYLVYDVGNENYISINEVYKKPENIRIRTTTGSTTRHLSNNIYDLAGGTQEITTEAFLNTDEVVTRGGCFYHSGAIRPSLHRYNIEKNSTWSLVGMRPAVFL